MTKNYLIGIGGTGARVIESFIYLCATGYGPDNDVTVFMIDPDRANGNLDTTTKLIDRYIDCRKSYFRGADQNTPSLFKTDVIKPLNCVWNIFDRADMSLSTYIGYENLRHRNPNFADLITLLYSGGHAGGGGELGTNLNEGFRGHPSIGAVVMSDIEQHKHEDPWRRLFSDISVANAEHDVRVFLVGSIFGGTGAAGVPTIGSRNLIKESQEAILGPGRSKVFLGGSLVMPYFVFDLPGPQEEGLFVTPADFAIATNAALRYYSGKVLTGDLGFDQVYFIGDATNQNVGKFHAGANNQKNNPHFIELATSLAAKDFFQQTITDESRGKYYIASRSDGPFTWESFPITKGAGGSAIAHRALITSMLVATLTAYGICAYGKAQLKSNSKDGWYKIHFNEKASDKATYSLYEQNNKVAHEAYEVFLDGFGKWICAVSAGPGRMTNLIDGSMILQGEEWVPYLPTSENISYLLLPSQPEKNPKKVPKFSTFIAYLNKKYSSSKRNASERYLDLFYGAAKEFVMTRYGIE